MRASLVQERSQKTSPLKKEVENLEKSIIKAENELKIHHENLITASHISDNSKIMEISQIIKKIDDEIEVKFERMEIVQNELDEMLQEYETKLSELSK